MPRRKTARPARGRKSRATRKSWRIPRILPSARLRGRLFKVYRSAPAGLQLAIAAVCFAALWLTLNWAYQVVRKPSELFFPVSDVLYKTPTETWRSYSSLFRKHSTHVITADFLAALAQVEASGNPVARTYWRWAWRPHPFEVYRPASSAVGMYQITDGTFAEARRYCVHDHVVVEDGPWNQPRSCWFNSLYTRTLATHSVELTSAYLDRRVATTLARHGIRGASLQQKHDLATVIHLCGAGAGNHYARRGLRLTSGQRCGDHDVAPYLAKVTAMKRIFARLARS
jgi:hypothetical protein